MAQLELSDVMDRAIRRHIKSNMYIHIPAKVTNVDDLNSMSVVDVLPCISDPYQDGTFVELPPINDVPVMFQSAGGGILSFPVQVGDTVLLLFSDRGLDEWKASTGSEDVYHPRTRRNSSLADAIALPGLYTTENNLGPSAEDVELNFKGSTIKIFSNGDVQINSDSNVIVNAGGDLTATVEGETTIESTGDVTLNTEANLTATVTGNATVTATGNVDMTGTVINLNGTVNVIGTLSCNGMDVGDTHGHIGDEGFAINGVT